MIFRRPPRLAHVALRFDPMTRTVALLLTLAACARSPARPPTSMHASPTASPAVEVTLRPLAEGVWLHTSRKDVAGYGRIPSHGLVVEGAEGLLLVDSAWGDGPTRELLGLIRARLGRTPAAVIVTHAHDDRVGGLAALREAGVAVYVTAETAALIAAHDGGVIAGALAVPVDRRALAGEAVEVFAPGAAHTLDNVVVWLPARGVLFGGCMIRPAGARALGNLADADLATWPASALRVAERYGAARVVVPTHGDPGDAALLTETAALAHASVPTGTRLRRAAQLPVRDGTAVTLCGTYTTHDPGALGPSNRRAGVVMEGDVAPRVFAEPPGDLAAWQGRRVCARGVFWREEPLRAGDPPHTARRSGWWLTGAELSADEGTR